MKQKKTLTISGFAQNPDIISEILTEESETLSYLDIHPEKLEERLAEYEGVDLIYAWSLGSLIAINYAHILKPKQLILFAPIYQYVATTDFLHGMNKNDFDDFALKLQNNPNELRKYFNLLIAKGSPNLRKIVTLLKEKNNNIDYQYLNEWLEYLATNKANLSKIEKIPGTIYHSKLDQVVSYKQSKYIKKQLPHLNLNLLEEGSHAPFLEEINQFNR